MHGVHVELIQYLLLSLLFNIHVVYAHSRCTSVNKLIGRDCALETFSNSSQCALMSTLTRDPARYIGHGSTIKRIHGPMVFGIGFGSAGTHSLSRILTSMGYNPMHYNPEAVLRAVHDRDFRSMLRCNAWLDDPIPSVWRILLEVFPEAKFIMVYRQDYYRHYAKDSKTCNKAMKLIEKPDKLDFDQRSRLLSRCMMYGDICPGNKTHNRELQDAHLEDVFNMDHLTVP